MAAYWSTKSICKSNCNQSLHADCGQSSHVSYETPHLASVEHDVPVKAVVVPGLEDGGVLEEGPERLQSLPGFLLYQST